MRLLYDGVQGRAEMLKTKRKKTDRQKQEALLDELYREYIRRRAMKRAGGCERCYTPKISYKDLQTAHCHGRGRHTLRWDESNSAGLCGACHMLIDAQPAEKEVLFRRLIGDEDYERIWVLAHMTTKESPIDHKLIEIELRELLKEV